MQEDLAEGKKEAPKLSVTERIVRILIHLGSWAASLGTAVAACAGVYFLSINNLQVSTVSKVSKEGDGHCAAGQTWNCKAG